MKVQSRKGALRKHSIATLHLTVSTFVLPIASAGPDSVLVQKLLKFF